MSIPKTEAATYGRRGRRALTSQYRYNVEGELLTSTEIAKRLDVSVSCAKERLRKAQARPESVSWLGLGLKPAE